MKLDPVLKKEIEAELGARLPDPRSEKFTHLQETLMQENPELADKLSKALYPEQLGDIEMEARKHTARENRWRKLQRALFMRYDDLDGEWHRSKVKLNMWGAGVASAVLLFLFATSGLLRRDSQVVQEPPGSPAQTASQPAQTETDDDPFADVVDQVEEDTRATDAFADGRVPANSSAGLPGETPEDSTNAQAAQAESSQGVAEDDNPFTDSQGSDPVLPSSSDEEDLGLRVFTASPGAQEAATSLRVYQAGTGNAGGNGSGSSGDDPFSESTSQTGAVGLAVYQMAPAERALDTNLRAYAREVPEGQKLHLYAQVPEQAIAARSQGQRATTAPAFQAPAQQPARPTPTPQTVAQLSLSSPPDVRTGRGNSSGFAQGDTLPARLQIGLIAIDETTLPVLVQADDGTIWSGEASLAPTGRVNMNFSQVYKNGRSYAVNALGQSRDGYLGLSADVSETTPALASDLARGALRGVSDYVQALSEQSTIALTDGTPIVSRQAPPLEMNIAGSLAQLFTPPEGDQQQALVRVARVAPNTPLRVVVMPPGQTLPLSAGSSE